MKNILFILISAFFLSTNVFAQDNTVHYCRSLHMIPYQDLMNAKVPSDTPKKLNLNRDGSWDFPLPVNEVFELYTSTPMSKAWASQYIVNRFTLVPGTNEMLDVSNHWYQSKNYFWAKDWPLLSQANLDGKGSERETWPGLRLGTRIYLDIKGALFTHACDMAIGFEVTQMIPNHMIELQYLDFSPPWGIQRISFAPNDHGGTTVTQVSYYKGKDRFLNALYRPFHREEIPGLHQRMQELAKKRLKDETRP